MRYVVIIASIIWEYFSYTNAKVYIVAGDNEIFALKIKSCVDSYADERYHRV